MQLKNLTYNEVLKKMKERFVFCDKVVEALWLGYQASVRNGHRNQNVILFGPPGHGKSEMVEEFLKIMGESDVVTYSASSGTRDSDIVAPIDVKKYMDTGVQELMFDQSILTHKIVVLEEGLDMPMRTFQALKDIITSGKVRRGKNVYPISTQFFIICTNRTKDEAAKDDATRAAFERFPITAEVIWPNYSAGSYTAMFEKVYPGKEDLSELSVLSNYLGEHASTKGWTPISPRTAMAMAKMYNSVLQYSDLRPLRHYEGVDKDLIEKTAERAVATRQAAKDNNFLNDNKRKLEVLIDDAEAIRNFQYTSIGDVEGVKLKFIENIEKLEVILKSTKIIQDEIAAYFNPTTRKVAVKDNVANAKVQMQKALEEQSGFVKDTLDKLRKLQSGF